MDEFIHYLVEYLPQICSGLLAVFSAVCSFIIYRLKVRQKSLENEALKAQLKEAKLRATYSICPECGKKVYLSDLHFYLPDGSSDEDLDGKAD